MFRRQLLKPFFTSVLEAADCVIVGLLKFHALANSTVQAVARVAGPVGSSASRTRAPFVIRDDLRSVCCQFCTPALIFCDYMLGTSGSIDFPLLVERTNLFINVFCTAERWLAPHGHLPLHSQVNRGQNTVLVLRLVGRGHGHLDGGRQWQPRGRSAQLPWAAL